MRHQRTNRKLGMKTPHRLSVLRNMATSLVIHERVRTTVTRAKELRKVVDKMITYGKQGDLNARRQAARFIRGNEAVQKLFSELGPRYKERPGGYTRIIRVGNRQGDNAPMVIIELVEAEMPQRTKAKKPAAKAEAAPAAEAATETAPAETEASEPAAQAAEAEAPPEAAQEPENAEASTEAEAAPEPAAEKQAEPDSDEKK